MQPEHAHVRGLAFHLTKFVYPDPEIGLAQGQGPVQDRGKLHGNEHGRAQGQVRNSYSYFRARYPSIYYNSLCPVIILDEDDLGKNSNMYKDWVLVGGEINSSCVYSNVGEMLLRAGASTGEGSRCLSRHRSLSRRIPRNISREGTRTLTRTIP